MGGHSERIFIVVAISTHAGFGNSRAVGIYVGFDFFSPQVVYVQHLAFGAPVSHQALGTFHDDVGCGAGFDGTGHLVIAGGIIQVFDLNFYVWFDGIECGDDLVDLFGFAPAADRIGPHCDADFFLCNG